MTDRDAARPAWITGLSARLLALTILAVMLAEVLIYLPSIARYRKVYLEDRIATAHLAIKALEATPDNLVGPVLERDLLRHAGAYAIASTSRDRRTLMLGSEPPPPVDVAFDLRHGRFPGWISQAMITLAQRDNRVLRVTGLSPRDPEVLVEVIIDETPMRQAMYAYSGRIVTLSIFISLITAGLVYLALHRLMVRPILRLTDHMVRFGEAPEDPARAIPPSARGDEIGTAQRALARIQRDLALALRQKTRLAALGAAVARINHDLRNALASAMLASDRLAANDDPEVARTALRLIETIDRAVALCASTLDFVRMERPPVNRSRFPAAELFDEVAAAAKAEVRADAPPPTVAVDGGGVLIAADRDQMFRALTNLAINAVQAGCTHLGLSAAAANGTIRIEVRDDGPGIPDAVRAALFKPFVSSGRRGGTGLGLVIANEIVAAHRGRISLLFSGSTGTAFRIELPDGSAASDGTAPPQGG